MRSLPRPSLALSVTYSRSDLAAVALLGAVVAGWAGLAAGEFSWAVLAACEVMFFGLYLAGALFAGWASLSAGMAFDLPLRLLVGYGIVNTALLGLAWLSPLGVLANFGVLLLLLLLSLLAAREREAVPSAPASLWVLGLCLLATSLWCQDSIRPTAQEDNAVLFKPWVDGFYHAVHVRLFGASHGAGTIEDFRMAEVPARLYHYGVYLLPAVIKAASGLHSYAAFAGILVPVGVLFTGLGAYALFASLWGRLAGLTACAALLLLPDGAQQGMDNAFLSYHWLTQISPSATHGLALLAVAWAFVLQGCVRGSPLQLAAGWLTLGVLAVYKLHFVIASAHLLLLLPPLFFRGRLRVRGRVIWMGSAAALYCLAMIAGGTVPGVPPLRLDGSSAAEILRLVQTFAEPGTVKEFFIRRMGAELPWTSNLLFGIPYVLFGSLGVFALLLAVLFIRMRARVPLLHRLFPLLVIVNFLVMFFGLALDFSRSTPDELSHRPIMIVYFVVVTWVGGASGFLLSRIGLRGRLAVPLGLGVASLLLAVPAFLGRGVQALPAMSRTSPVRVPSSLLEVVSHLRKHGGPADVFQDSQFDRTYVLGALSERRTFVSHTMTTMPFRGDLVAARTAAVDRLMSLRDPKLVAATARTFGIRWFILQRGNSVNWPSSAIRPVLEAGPFRLYEF